MMFPGKLEGGHWPIHKDGGASPTLQSASMADMKAETRQYIRTYIIGLATAIAVVLVVIVPMLRDIRETLTATGTVHVENALDAEIFIEDVRTSRQLAMIPAQSHWSAKFALATYEDGMSMTTFRMVTGDGRSAEVQSNTFISHRAKAQEHGVEILSLDGKATRTMPSTIGWHSQQQLEAE